jgi:hypothetical protein
VTGNLRLQLLLSFLLIAIAWDSHSNIGKLYGMPVGENIEGQPK